MWVCLRSFGCWKQLHSSVAAGVVSTSFQRIAALKWCPVKSWCRFISKGDQKTYLAKSRAITTLQAPLWGQKGRPGWPRLSNPKNQASLIKRCEVGLSLWHHTKIILRVLKIFIFCMICRGQGALNHCNALGRFVWQIEMQWFHRRSLSLQGKQRNTGNFTLFPEYIHSTLAFIVFKPLPPFPLLWKSYSDFPLNFLRQNQNLTKECKSLPKPEPPNIKFSARLIKWSPIIWGKLLQEEKRPF